MNKEVSTKAIESKILTIRNQPVMLDRDLAELYGVETRRLNEQVKRNIERFPDSFMFQLTREEVEIVKSQIVTSKMENELVMSQIATSPETNTSNMFSGQDGGTRKLPYAFTEQGVAMLSAVLKSNTAIQMSIQIMNAFVSMRHFLHSNARLFVELDSIKQHLIRSDIHQKETDKKVQELFSLIDKYNVKETQGIFFQGQIFDAYAKFESFISSATQEIILIDNYVDVSILERLAKKKKNVSVTIFTDPKTKLTAQDVQKFNAQYPVLTVKNTTKMHDRFLIIDRKTLYHIGASLKDLGKKCFAFEVLDSAHIPYLLQNV